jgi:hypothetical protein
MLAHPSSLRAVSLLAVIGSVVAVCLWSTPAAARHGGLYVELGAGYGAFQTDEVIVDYDKQPGGGLAQSSLAPTLKLGLNLFGWGGVEAIASGHYWGLGADLGGGAYGGGVVRLTPLEALKYVIPEDFTMWSPQGNVGWKDRPFDVGVSFGGGYTIIGEDFAYQGSYFQWGFDTKFYITPNFAIGVDIPIRTPTYVPLRYTNFGDGDGLCTNGGKAFGVSGLEYPASPTRFLGDEFNGRDLSGCDGTPPAATFITPSFTIAGVFDFGV